MASTPVIFLSYCWANKAIADIIDEDFKKLGFVLKRDIRDLPFRSNIPSFMQETATADFVLVLISHEYLCSENCLYEMGELLNTHRFEQRILPIILDNAWQIFTPARRDFYYNFWRQKLEEAEQRKRQLPNFDTVAHAKKIAAINALLDDFFTKIMAINAGHFDSLRGRNYSEVTKIIRPESDEMLKGEVDRILKTANLEEREQSLTLFTTSHPEYWYGLFQTAFVAFERGNYAKARYFYELQNSKYPDHAASHYNLGLLLETRFHEYEAALREYETTLRLDPKHLPAYNGLVYVLYLHLKDYPASRIYCEGSLRIDPGQPDIHCTLAGLLHYHLADYVSARRHYEESLRLDPAYENAQFGLSALLKQHFAIPIPDQPAAPIDLRRSDDEIKAGYSFYQQRDYKNAERHYLEALRYYPGNAVAYNNLGGLQEFQYVRHMQARQYYETALRLAPDLEIARTNLNRVLKR